MPDSINKRPTIRDVAQRAGVSKSLVSLVMKNAPTVGEERRERVLAAAAELGYEINWVARFFSAGNAGNSKIIALLVRDLEQPWTSEFVDVARPVLEDAGYTVLISLLSPPGPNQPIDFSILQVFRDLHVAGLMFVGAMQDHTAFNHIVTDVAIVFAGWAPEDPELVDIVKSDDFAGMSLVVEHLIEKGHRRISHIGGVPGVVSQTRADAYRSVMRKHNLDEFISVISGDFTLKAGHAAAIDALSAREDIRPTALACADDAAAIGAMSAADELGLTIAVTGYDNIAFGALHRINLTTVDADNASLGELAAQTLLRRIEDSTAPPVYRLVDPTLIVRSSSVAANE
jgi:DNA-binding LacI/PurR family transcriptional regulator